MHRRWIWIFLASFIAYGSLIVDVLLALTVYLPDDYESASGIGGFINSFGLLLLTLVLVVLPGLFQCYVDKYTRYLIEDDGKPQEERLFPTVKKTYIKCFRYGPTWFLKLLNIFRLRLIYEVIVSMVLRKASGAFKDTLTIQAIFQSFPVCVMQSLVWYNFEFKETEEEVLVLLSAGISLLVIALLPKKTPCFKEAHARWESKPKEPSDDIRKTQMKMQVSLGYFRSDLPKGSTRARSTRSPRKTSKFAQGGDAKARLAATPAGQRDRIAQALRSADRVARPSIGGSISFGRFDRKLTRT